jgi:hypothetical protein
VTAPETFAQWLGLTVEEVAALEKQDGGREALRLALVEALQLHALWLSRRRGYTAHDGTARRARIDAEEDAILGVLAEWERAAS